VGIVQKIEPPDSHHVLAAIGWLELRNLAEAKAELANVNPSLVRHPDVLEIRWIISAEEKQWEEALRAAQELIEIAPERSSGWLHQAYALRRIESGGVRKAWESLLPAFDKFPQESTIPYNLSCYACQLRQMEAARVWLKRALVLGGKEKIKRMALQDEDLEPLWQEIREM
jgi:tetratricopeptide (TPR) repeat protein